MRIALVGSGAMGTALGAGWIAGGCDVVTCLDGRTVRSHRLAELAGLGTVASLDDAVASDVVVSVVPPAAALRAATDIAAAAARTGAGPLVVDLNAVAPPTMSRIAAALAAAGLQLVDGSISGPPPTAARATRVYLSGPEAGRIVELPSPWLDVVRLDGDIGAASALKMCTASMYKGTKALVMQAMLTAQQHGVLDQFLADTARQWPDDVPGWPTDVALAAAKSSRFVGEMHEIALTQAGAGLPRLLFDGVAAAYEHASRSSLGRTAPESLVPDTPAEQVLAGLAVEGPLPAAVLFDFSDTLFRIESAEATLLASLGPEHVHRADDLRRVGGLNGLARPDDLPASLADAWDRRDLSADAHRAAYSGAARLAGLSAEQARAVYDRGISAEAWHPYPDTVRTVRELHERGVRVALISNIGFNPRPILARYGVERDIDVLVLSDERGVLKPDPAIFRLACDELGVQPSDCVMVGDNPVKDGAAVQLGIRFELVTADPTMRAPDELARAVGLGGEEPTHE